MRVSRLGIFPIKSLDGVRVESAAITAGGILENDRVYAIVDAQGCFVNGKRTSEVHRLRASFDPAIREVRLWTQGKSPAQFPLMEPEPLERWLSEFFAMPVALKHDPIQGFPDDNEAFGPTIVSEASLRRVRQWYPELTLESIRRRFRTNVELEGEPPFCEDRLFAAPGERKAFRIGQVLFFGHNPCQRCVVPTRDPETGEAIHAFQKSFADRRKQELPDWSDERRFNHFYRFAVNTSIPPSEAGKRLYVGDVVEA